MDGIEVAELVIELIKEHSKIMSLRMLQNNNLIRSCSFNRLEES